MSIRPCKNKRVKYSKFDERQQLARGKAFRAAYYVLSVYLLISGFIRYVLEVVWCNGLLDLEIGIYLSITIFAIICLKNDAYIPMHESPKEQNILSGVICLLFLAIAVVYIISGQHIIINGQLSFSVSPFLLGIMYLIILPFSIARSMANKKNIKTE